jgi:hypothetical protein
MSEKNKNIVNVRLQVPKKLHTAIKIEAIGQNKNIHDYIIDILSGERKVKQEKELTE